MIKIFKKKREILTNSLMQKIIQQNSENYIIKLNEGSIIIVIHKYFRIRKLDPN